jgi:hypothetical protein
VWRARASRLPKIDKTQNKNTKRLLPSNLFSYIRLGKFHIFVFIFYRILSVFECKTSRKKASREVQKQNKKEAFRIYLFLDFCDRLCFVLGVFRAENLLQNIFFNFQKTISHRR